MAQIFFYLVTRVTQTVPGFKAAVVLIDLVTMGFVAATLRATGQPAERVIVYAWHPLPIFEFGASGHIDALMICFLAIALFARAREKYGIAGIALGAATLVKFIPVVLLPAMYRRWDKKLPVAYALTIGLCYLPYVVSAGACLRLPAEIRRRGRATEWSSLLSAGSDQLFTRLVRSRARAAGAVFTGIALASLGAIAVWAFWRQPRSGKKTGKAGINGSFRLSY